MTETGDRKRLILGEEFLTWLQAAGVVPDRTRRVVIDAEVGQAVQVFAELYGSELMIKVEVPRAIRAADVHVVGD